MKPLENDCPPYFHRYVSLVPQEDLISALQHTSREALDLMRTIPTALENHAYAPGKWTVREVFLHCVDTERIFGYRALCIARGEKQKLLSFEEDEYAAHSRANTRPLSSIADELESVSRASLSLFQSFDEETLAARGEMSSGPATVKSIGFMISGHLIHHMNVVRERYLK